MKQGRKVSAIAVGLALSGLTSLSPAYAQQADEEAANLERIAVTGSRIKRTDMEGPSPIQSIDATMIEGMGYENLNNYSSVCRPQVRVPSRHVITAKIQQPMARQRYPSEVWDQMQRLF